MKEAASRRQKLSPIHYGGITASLTVFILFLLSAGTNDFVALDDYAYIIYNHEIAEPTWNHLASFFTRFTEGNWHPVTMLSLMLDRWIWGLDPFGYHLTSIFIHSTTVFFLTQLFSDLLQMRSGNYSSEKSILQSALPATAAALFFGLHPLRVESVVWASERKDVLFLFFLVLALRFYVSFASGTLNENSRPRWEQYAAAVSMTALATMSKPAAVTIPVILLLLDWYPLRRLHGGKAFIFLCLEKLPFLLLSVVSIALNYVAHAVAMGKLPQVTTASRFLVACKGILFYLAKTIYPFGLAAFYPHPGDVAHGTSLNQYIFYASIVILVTLTTLCYAKRRPLWLSLWLFHLVSLSPMLGLIQVGEQWAADRYSYLPSITLSLLWGAGAAWLFYRLRQSGSQVTAMLCLILAVSQLLFYSYLTVRQVSFWRNTETIASRIIEMSPRKLAEPYHARALYRFNAGQYQRALEDNSEAIRIALGEGRTGLYPLLGNAQARVLFALGKYEDALAAADWAFASGRNVLPADFAAFREKLSQAALER